MPRIAQKASINYWHHFTSTTEFKGLERVMALFKQRYPDIAVTQENIPNPEYMSKMTAAVVANAKPDTCMVVAERAGDLVAMGALIDLTDKIKAWPRYAEYPAQAWEGCTVDGKIYGIPAFTFVDWMYYRKDWFAEKGIAPPKTYQSSWMPRSRSPTRRRTATGSACAAAPAASNSCIDLIEFWGSPIVVDGKAAIDKKKAVEAVDVLCRPPDEAQGRAAERAERRLPADHGGLQDRPDRDGLAPHRLAHRDPGGA